jgi:16S rRNA (uracil1498-N3)-methyltransferase
MAMPRLFVPHLLPDTATVRLAGNELRHLRAFRLGAGDHLVLFDGAGREQVVRLVAIDRHAATADVLETCEVDRESALELISAPAVLKGTRMDTIFEKGTELGVSRFVPLHTARVQGQRNQRPRWSRVVRAAATQSGRTRVPPIDEPSDLQGAIAAFPEARVVIAWEGERAGRLRDLPTDTRRVLAVTGPEGGLTPAEVEAAVAAGAHPVGLGRRILRAETAAITLAALCQHHFGDV